MHNEGYTIFNIREFLQEENDGIGEADLIQILSDFSCPLNKDVEKFLKERAIEFTKKNQSVTYLVFSSDDANLVGYFTLTIKPITINATKFSNTTKRKLLRVSELDDVTHTFHLAAYLIAQLGKNYSNGANFKITGEQLLEIAMSKVRDLQFMVGGMVVFLESEQNDKLIQFYDNKNGFKEFETRAIGDVKEESHTLIQMLKVL